MDSLAFTIRDPDLVPADQTPALSDLRLFGTGGGTDLAEWDIERGTIRVRLTHTHHAFSKLTPFQRTIPSQGGSIWSIAPNPASTVLALGCEDGSIHLLSLELDSLTHLRRFDRVKSRILSLAWAPPVPRDTSSNKPNTRNTDDSDEDEDVTNDWSDSWLVAGCSDSSLRKWDVVSGRVLDRMSVDKNKGERTLVWTVGVLGCVPYYMMIYCRQYSLCTQRWHRHIRRFSRCGQVLGLPDLYTAALFPSARCRCTLHDHQHRTSLFTSISYTPH